MGWQEQFIVMREDAGMYVTPLKQNGGPSKSLLQMWCCVLAVCTILKRNIGFALYAQLV